MTVRAKHFEDIEAANSQPGAISLAADGKGLFYICPCGCGMEGYLAFKPAPSPSWSWNGDTVNPTLMPSVHHRIDGKTHWHGWLRNGEWRSI